MIKVFKGKTIYSPINEIEGEAIVCKKPISFFGDVNGKEGIIKIDNEKFSISGKVLVIPYTIGSTVGPYILYQLFKYGKKPISILTVKADTLLIIGCVFCDIPLMSDLPEEILNIKQYSKIKIKFNDEIVEVYE